MNTMKILFVSPEAVPYAKTGGLADVAGALPKSIAAQGHSVALIMPLYKMVDRDKFGITEIASDLPAKIAGREEKFSIYQGKSDIEGFNIFFVGNMRYFNRPELYRDPATGKDWADNDERFGFFSRAVLETCKNRGFIPDIVHCNDWQSGLIPALIKEDPSFKSFAKTASLFSIHNIA